MAESSGSYTMNIVRFVGGIVDFFIHSPGYHPVRDVFASLRLFETASGTVTCLIPGVQFPLVRFASEPSVIYLCRNRCGLCMLMCTFQLLVSTSLSWLIIELDGGVAIQWRCRLAASSFSETNTPRSTYPAAWPAAVSS
ncbi:hypothetical protein HGRIS_014974 [Hohenbuehelia grisea]|uniref:Uncharacterized protein n=1 Tax=Hohenbuehelia grisea TaxID=104357 RepID=A0ABR3ISM3_9AGAR